MGRRWIAYGLPSFSNRKNSRDALPVSFHVPSFFFHLSIHARCSMTCGQSQQRLPNEFVIKPIAAVPWQLALNRRLGELVHFYRVRRYGVTREPATSASCGWDFHPRAANAALRPESSADAARRDGGGFVVAPAAAKRGRR